MTPVRRTSTPTRRRRRDSASPQSALLKGVATIAVLGAIAWIGISAYNGVPGKQYSYLVVEVPRVGNLLKHDPVRIAGVRVGQIQDRTIGDNGLASIRVQLEPGLKLPTDTKAAVRANGLLGARYLQIIPGSGSRMLASGDTIGGPHDVLSFGVTEALDTFDRQTRGALGQMIGGLGSGFAGNGQVLNAGIHASGTRMHEFQNLIHTTLEPQGAAARLLPALDRAVTPLAANRTQIAGTFGPGADAVAPFVTERDSVRSSLEQSPGALSSANTGLGNGVRLLSATDDLANAADQTLQRAPEGLRQAADLLDDADGPLDKAADLLDAARPAVPGALRVTDSLNPVLNPLRQGIVDLVPIVHEVGIHKCDIINTGAVFRSMTGFGGTGSGPNGPAMQFRLQAVMSPSENLGMQDHGDTKLFRDGYPDPCEYLSTKYPLQSYDRAGATGP
ncbi:MAG: phospholipid/cholesterol/gamma-HCH transport system substrate-binding protein [Thermoleophilaceae bacterium]|jgi:phospholipid/cholesterol/gamma-HCH transport system substrate-binding protein|nr:phospholipid/cholesterol/gamma-HCH transport system substrate-binding protein [Thermoleophilaceae bacterium]